MSRRIFPLAVGCVPGDLIFFHRLPATNVDSSADSRGNSFESAVVSASRVDSSVYHVAIAVGDPSNAAEADSEERVVHAAGEIGVHEEQLSEAITRLQPDIVELAHIANLGNSSSEWKTRAAEWARAQVGKAGYNDIFSPDCIDSQGRRAFYCCQLAVEAYKAPHTLSAGKSPFLPHKLNFCDHQTGELIPFWVAYYKEKCPNHPKVPQDEPGSHPSILRVSPCVKITAIRHIQTAGLSSTSLDNGQMMRRFTIATDLVEALHFINGARVSLSASGASKRFDVVEPRKGSVLCKCEAATEWHVKEVVEAARTAQLKWSATPWLERGKVLKRAADLIRRHCNDIALWETRDNGKPIREAKSDILSCADTFDYFSGVDLGGEHLPYGGDERFAYTQREPYGVVGAIGVWNYPFLVACWTMAPAIACGNSVIYKPSPLAPVTSVLLAQLLQCAGLPDGVVNVVQGDAETGTAICRSTDIRKISFTGSVGTGQRVAELCATPSIKPATLELGGKSSVLMFADADVDSCVNGALAANFYTQGQVCTNASKVLVQRPILAEFQAKLLQRVEELRIGDPLNESTHIGACISLQHMRKIQAHIKKALEEGAHVLYGGEHVIVEALEEGYYLSPCVLTDVQRGMSVYSEEIFGPVLLIIPFDEEAEALHMANDTDFGLAAGVFTNDLKRAHRLSTQLKAGTIYVNTYNDFSPFLPFGGFGQSGYGRENGKAAIEAYTQVKSVYVNAAGKMEDPFPC